MMSKLKTTVLAALTIASFTSASAAQGTWFASVGGGANLPRASSMMNTGWLAEGMAGVALPGNVVSLRVGGTYARNRMKSSPASVLGMGMGSAQSSPSGEPETDRSLSAMAGVMVMPDWERDLIPYVLGSAGVMNGMYRGSHPGFAWASGGGVRLLTDLAEFYVEGRFVRSTGATGHGDMVPITAGVRFTRW